MPRRNRKTEQQKNGELGLIIDRFAQAMWSANRDYVAAGGRPTPKMDATWNEYVLFCVAHPE